MYGSTQTGPDLGITSLSLRSYCEDETPQVIELDEFSAPTRYPVDRIRTSAATKPLPETRRHLPRAPRLAQPILGGTDLMWSGRVPPLGEPCLRS